MQITGTLSRKEMRELPIGFHPNVGTNSRSIRRDAAGTIIGLNNRKMTKCRMKTMQIIRTAKQYISTKSKLSSRKVLNRDSKPLSIIVHTTQGVNQ